MERGRAKRRASQETEKGGMGKKVECWIDRKEDVEVKTWTTEHTIKLSIGLNPTLNTTWQLISDPK